MMASWLVLCFLFVGPVQAEETRCEDLWAQNADRVVHQIQGVLNLENPELLQILLRMSDMKDQELLIRNLLSPFFAQVYDFKLYSEDDPRRKVLRFWRKASLDQRMKIVQSLLDGWQEKLSKVGVISGTPHQEWGSEASGRVVVSEQERLWLEKTTQFLLTALTTQAIREALVEEFCQDLPRFIQRPVRFYKLQERREGADYFYSTRYLDKESLPRFGSYVDYMLYHWDEANVQAIFPAIITGVTAFLTLFATATDPQRENKALPRNTRTGDRLRISLAQAASLRKSLRISAICCNRLIGASSR